MLDNYINNDKTREYYFYYKDKSRNISPVKNDKINLRAKEKLDLIYKEYNQEIPKKFRDNWHLVKLYDSKGDVEKAHSILLSPEEGSYDLKNKLNHMTGKNWTKFTCSWFIFNALHKDLKEERDICSDLQHHPATYSPTMMEDFINFFTKEGMRVLDPFLGIGSTAVGCKRTNRIPYGVELNEKYYQLILKRVPEFKHNIVNDDSRNIKNYFKDIKFDFCISSPPYWDVLNRSTGDFKKKRTDSGFDYKYSDTETDLGNIDDYQRYIKDTAKIYIDIFDLLKVNSYLVIIVKNIKKEGKFYPLAWDLARVLSEKYALKDEKIWIQDKIGLAPYGYPHNWTSNILHHYCLIFRKEN